jgi:5-methylcytosine-specific restriction endonuclease McrA
LELGVKKTSIKAHLKKYSLVQKRKTTINNAFASAIAPFDTYDEQRIDTAITFLGQPPEENLVCVYCGEDAQTWDHLVSLVEGGKLRGFGHQLGNLVPCCKACNSQKGSKDFALFISSSTNIKDDKEELIKRLGMYARKFAQPLSIDLVETHTPKEWNRYNQIRKEIIDLLKEADELADILREKIVIDKRSPVELDGSF